MTDQQLERELRAWFHAAVPASETAPGALRAGVAWIPRTVEAPRLVVSRRRLGLLAVAAALAATLIGLAIAGPGGWLPTRSPLASAPASELPSPNPTSARASSWTD